MGHFGGGAHFRCHVFANNVSDANQTHTHGQNVMRTWNTFNDAKTRKETKQKSMARRCLARERERQNVAAVPSKPNVCTGGGTVQAALSIIIQTKVHTCVAQTARNMEKIYNSSSSSSPPSLVYVLSHYLHPISMRFACAQQECACVCVYTRHRQMLRTTHTAFIVR